MAKATFAKYGYSGELTPLENRQYKLEEAQNWAGYEQMIYNNPV